MSGARQVKARPTLALAMGDPSGISLELVAKLLADAEVRAAANFIVVGDASALAAGARIAKLDVELPTWNESQGEPDFAKGAVLLDLGHVDPSSIATGESSEVGGRFALTNFRKALQLARARMADAVTFTPFNKRAMRLAHPGYIDEIEIVSEELEGGPGREFNVLPKIWNARVTSHVPLSEVASRIKRQAVVDALVLTDRCMRGAGFERPRIAVAALNPHAGDGGNFGHEDDGEIAPAVSDARARGIVCDGPFPSDTVFLRALRGEFDGVQTMYHDQGQIAIKLLGFEEGVTLIGGYSVPVCTPAHGTAYDIVGKGIANAGASKAAMLLASRLAVRMRESTAAAE
jgi:4-hydroxythreonine-4-phosphate dehydrogenase